MEEYSAVHRDGRRNGGENVHTSGGFVRADQIDLKSLDDQIHRHLIHAERDDEAEQEMRSGQRRHLGLEVATVNEERLRWWVRREIELQ
ncbi:hypothetical protein SASPL_144390 [Salvia splendens]|uniref:Uncharacterized protein n=1 Tax=Salvia splendens TaxID=180675 RepID=A0A8X8WFM9_SALSN|nr:hypothetical protein SASPL_144390 [Salvia splendens]